MCERYGWAFEYVWDALPLSVLNLLARQEGSSWKRAPFGTAELELAERLELPD